MMTRITDVPIDVLEGVMIPAFELLHDGWSLLLDCSIYTAM